MRLPHWVSFCQLGFANTPLHPLPALDHADSAQPRVEPDLTRDVPPTARTNGDVAGNWAPAENPLSPELAVTRMPGWS
jgi:hypothetical protein